MNTDETSLELKPDPMQWRLRRIDIRSPISPQAWPVARVELDHPERGRVTDLGTAPGAFDALFLAAGQILGISPELRSFNVQSAAPGADGALTILVEVSIGLDGQVYVGRSFGLDLVECSLRAWLEAASKASSRHPAAVRCAARPFQVCGVDENHDVWFFASEDEGAAEEIATEFRDEGFVDVRLLTHRSPELAGAPTRSSDYGGAL